MIEGEPTGDGRLVDKGALNWEGVLPIAIVFDMMEGDHTAPVVGAVEELTRKPGGVVWADGYVEDSDVPEVQGWVTRARELLEQGAVGVSVRLDSEVVEMRVKRELVEVSPLEEVAEGGTQLEEDASGERIIVARYAADDVIFATTSARVRHLAIVDTAAIVTPEGHRFGIAATGAIAASALAGDWDAFNYMFDDPRFGEPGQDDRLRYDPDRGAWSCPPTVDDKGRYFGHVTPMGICLRGRTDRCINPPEGDLEGFMRGRAPAAGGRRTGVVVCGEGSSHCDVGIGAALATQHYDKVGSAYAAADVRVGRDRYGIWFSGMVRPGTPPDTVYKLEASDVSGHWELMPSGRTTLVGLPAVSVGGFPKGYLTYQEVREGVAAAAGISIEEGCSSWTALAESDERDEALSAILERLDQLGTAVGEMYAAHLRGQDDT